MDVTDYDHSERVYKWTIRALYVTALTLNAWVLWDQVKESPEAQLLMNRLRQANESLMRPIRDREHFRKTANEVVYEAITVVEQAQEGTTGDE